jgi:hypothetical protein
MTTGYIVQAALQNRTAMAADQCENTFHFTGASTEPTDSDIAGCIGRIADFYVATHGAALPITNWYSSEYPTIVIKVYDLAAAKPRPILGQATVTLPGPAAGTPLPEEVALCLSYYSNRNIPRKRGRIYLGPFSSNSLGAGAPGVSRPDTTFLASVAAAGTALLATSDGATSLGSIADSLSLHGILTTAPTFANVSWVLYSTLGEGTKAAPLPETDLLTAGWVDNEWDGQHRRRVKASARTLIA